MNTENDNTSTPKRTKRLGLGRGNSMLKKGANNLAGCSAKSKIDTETPGLTPKSRFPQSDIKINYKCLEQNTCSQNKDHGECKSATPKHTNSTHLQRLAVSTNCRPYRLALSKKIRENMTKKRLEFYLANETEKDEFKEQQTEKEHQHYKTSKIFSSTSELLDKIDCAQKELAARQGHLKKVEELKHLISIWKTGFSSALHDLQNKIEPRLETRDLLECLHIPQDMIKYVNE